MVDKDGRQPILWAASAGSSDAILALVKAGANVEAHDKDGLTGKDKFSVMEGVQVETATDDSVPKNHVLMAKATKKS